MSDLNAVREYVQDRLQFHKAQLAIAQRELSDPENNTMGNQPFFRGKVSAQNTCLGLCANILKLIDDGYIEERPKDEPKVVIPAGAMEELRAENGVESAQEPAEAPELNQALSQKEELDALKGRFDRLEGLIINALGQQGAE